MFTYTSINFFEPCQFIQEVMGDFSAIVHTKVYVCGKYQAKMSVPNNHWSATTTFCADHGQWPADVMSTVIYVIRTSPFVGLLCSVFTGVVLQYFVVNATVWWLFHLLSIFYSVMFPFTARRWKKKQKYIHLVLLIIGKGHVCMSIESQNAVILLSHLSGLLIPVPGVIVALTGDSQQYAVANFPPLFCGPSDEDLIFYSIMFILNLMLMAGIPILIILFWILHKVCFCKGILMFLKRDIDVLCQVFDLHMYMYVENLCLHLETKKEAQDHS